MIDADQVMQGDLITVQINQARELSGMYSRAVNMRGACDGFILIKVQSVQIDDEDVVIHSNQWNFILGRKTRITRNKSGMMDTQVKTLEPSITPVVTPKINTGRRAPLKSRSAPMTLPEFPGIGID